MGVPAFFKWLSTKYPKIIADCIEERASWSVNGEHIPIDSSKANPNGVELDNLYLDMNGIIHPASHPEDRPPPETEDDMYLSIFAYLERVFAAARPRKLLFMAIDGVAPRAKMNQQRARRFKSAQEAQEKEEEEARMRREWAAQGRQVPPPKPGHSQGPGGHFDSNTITPGTPFMERLAVFLNAFIHKKQSEDAAWRGIKVILSDGSVPGEGEHKIMEFIRRQRREPGYDPNTRHCIHGLDADLIMLALSTHEPHFSILREYVGPADQKPQPKSLEQAVAAAVASETTSTVADDERTPFQFLQIHVLREYLHKEFSGGDYSVEPRGFDLERAIDDFIFLCFFVGNDFLPHMPSLDIRNGAIDTLCDLYLSTFGKLGGWITDGGSVDLARVQIFCVELGKMEDELLRRHQANEDRFKSQQKKREWEKANGGCAKKHADFQKRIQAMGRTTGGKPADVLGRDALVFEIFEMIKAFAALPDSAPAQPLPSGLNGYQRAMAYNYCDECGVANEASGKEPNRVVSLVKRGGAQEPAAAQFKRELGEVMKVKNVLPEQPDLVQLGKPGWRERYYAVKFPELQTAEARAGVALKFAEGMCWVMRYYYEGCASWKWFFPYHYAPFAGDMALAIRPEQPFHFEPGEPFLPFQQLMGVLPPRSAHALPTCLGDIMKDPTSSIADLYPLTFDLDPNGKKFAWQAVVKLPFIDEARLLAVMALHDASLSAEEVQRNSHGSMLLFVSDAHVLFPRIRALYLKKALNDSRTPSLRLKAEMGGGLAGSLEPLALAPLPFTTFVVPEFRGFESKEALQDFHSLAVSVLYVQPEAPSEHARPTLLPGVQFQPPALHPTMDAPVPSRFFMRAPEAPARHTATNAPSYAAASAPAAASACAAANACAALRMSYTLNVGGAATLQHPMGLAPRQLPLHPRLPAGFQPLQMNSPSNIRPPIQPLQMSRMQPPPPMASIPMAGTAFGNVPMQQHQQQMMMMGVVHQPQTMGVWPPQQPKMQLQLQQQPQATGVRPQQPMGMGMRPLQQQMMPMRPSHQLVGGVLATPQQPAQRMPPSHVQQYYPPQQPPRFLPRQPPPSALLAQFRFMPPPPY